jgi:hypothetical protein
MNFAVVGGLTFEVSFTGTMTGPLTLCFSYDENDVQDENNLRLLHFENLSWLDVTTFVDTTLNKICGQTTSLSPFAVVEPDTDGDGMPDVWETTYGLNPNNAADATISSDADTLTNLQEYGHGTNPTLADTDSDGMPDDWEVLYGLNPIVDDASADTDNDGVNNLAEYAAHTNPTVNNTPPPSTPPTASTKAVPVFEGWWALLGILSGLGIVRRRFRKA